MEKPLTCCWYLLLINVVCSLLRTSSNSGAFVLSLSVSPRLSLLAAASDAAAEHNSNMQYMVKAAGSDKPHREAAVDVEESRQRPLQSSTEEFQYMSQIYYHRSQEILAGPSSGSQREGRCQRPESTVIHSYPFLGEYGVGLTCKRRGWLSPVVNTNVDSLACRVENLYTSFETAVAGALHVNLISSGICMLHLHD